MVISLPHECSSVVTCVILIFVHFIITSDAYLPTVLNNRHKGVPSLAIAASNGSLKRMVTALDSGADVNQLDWLGQTALHMAAKFQQTHAAKLLLEHGASVNIPNADFQETPLHLAAKTGSLGIIQLLIEYGANVNAQISRNIIPGGTPLLYAAFYDSNSFQTAKLLMEHGADWRARNSFGLTALHLYVEHMNLRAVTVLVGRFHADPNVRSDNGCAPLNILTVEDPSASQTAIAAFLLDNGADVNSRCLGDGSSRRTPLHTAVLNENHPLIELFLDYGANVDTVDRKGVSPLYSAVVFAAKLDSNLVKSLLQRGANPNARPNSTTPCNSLLSAFLRRNFPVNEVTARIVGMLINHGAEKDRFCPESEMPLIAQHLEEYHRLMYAESSLTVPPFFMEEGGNGLTSSLLHPRKSVPDVIKAASFGDVGAIIKMFESFNNNSAAIAQIVNVRDSYGKTALHWSAAGEYIHATRTLLRAGANPNLEDSTSSTPIVYAAATGNVDVLTLLLGYGASINRNAALKVAIDRSNNPEAVEVLLNGGAVLTPDESTELLQSATSKQNIRMMQILIEHGANVNGRLTESGQGPLSTLLDSDCCYPQLPVLSTLLDYGADINARDNQGRTPLAVAITVRRRKEVIRFLLEHAANPNIPDSRGCNTPLFLLLRMAGTETGRYHLHSITSHNDDDEVAQITRDLIFYGAWTERVDPCFQQNSLELAMRKNLTQTAFVLHENLV